MDECHVSNVTFGTTRSGQAEYDLGTSRRKQNTSDLSQNIYNE